MTTDAVPAEQLASMEIQRLLKSLDALANPACCKGASTSVFQVMGRDGKPTGEEVRLCDACGRQLD
jgi:hypothetical protein